MGRLQTKKGYSKKYIEEQIANIANIAFKWQLKEIKFKSFQLQAIRNKNIQKDLKSIILVLLQLFNIQMRTLTSKLISLTSYSHRKVKGNPFIGGIVLFCRILMAFVATSPW